MHLWSSDGEGTACLEEVAVKREDEAAASVLPVVKTVMSGRTGFICGAGFGCRTEAMLSSGIGTPYWRGGRVLPCEPWQNLQAPGGGGCAVSREQCRLSTRIWSEDVACSLQLDPRRVPGCISDP